MNFKLKFSANEVVEIPWQKISSAKAIQVELSTFHCMWSKMLIRIGFSLSLARSLRLPASPSILPLALVHALTNTHDKSISLCQIKCMFVCEHQKERLSELDIFTGKRIAQQIKQKKTGIWERIQLYIGHWPIECTQIKTSMNEMNLWKGWLFLQVELICLTKSLSVYRLFDWFVCACVKIERMYGWWSERNFSSQLFCIQDVQKT